MKKLINKITPDLKMDFMVAATLKNPEFIVTDTIRPELENIMMYFCGIEGKYNLNKGLYIVGEYGIGKTILMSSFQRFLASRFPFNSNCFAVTSVEQLISYYRENDCLNKFVSVVTGKQLHLCINEFGKKLNEKIYGTDANEVINSFMMIRYELFQEHKILTHVTSNFMPESTDLALFDRYVEMFNIIKLTGKSMRK